MLKFLEGREEAVRSPIKYVPEMAYGNSFESPPEFQTSSTIFYRRSYINPFLKFEPSRAQKLPPSATASVQPQWTQKQNLGLV
jgi:hypothetical protein